MLDNSLPETRPTRRIGPRLRARVRTALGPRGWPRVLALRRLAALGLVLAAGVLAVRPAAAETPATASVVVAVRDLAPGVTLGAADVAVRRWSPGERPAGGLSRVVDAVGRVTAGAVRAGEPLTDVRLLGTAAIRLSGGDPSSVAVPVRLADPAVGDLLHPGARVDVVTVDPAQQADPVLAADAIVLTVRNEAPVSGDRQRLLVVALPPEAATRVAALSLRQPVTVTLR